MSGCNVPFLSEFLLKIRFLLDEHMCLRYLTCSTITKSEFYAKSGNVGKNWRINRNLSKIVEPQRANHIVSLFIDHQTIKIRSRQSIASSRLS